MAPSPSASTLVRPMLMAVVDSGGGVDWNAVAAISTALTLLLATVATIREVTLARRRREREQVARVSAQVAMVVDNHTKTTGIVVHNRSNDPVYDVAVIAPDAKPDPNWGYMPHIALEAFLPPSDEPIRLKDGTRRDYAEGPVWLYLRDANGRSWIRTPWGAIRRGERVRVRVGRESMNSIRALREARLALRSTPEGERIHLRERIRALRRPGETDGEYAARLQETEQ